MTWGKDTPEWKQKKKAKANKKAHQLPYGILLSSWNNMAILIAEWTFKFKFNPLTCLSNSKIFISAWVVTSWLDQGQMSTDYAQKVGGQKNEAWMWSGVKSHQNVHQKVMMSSCQNQNKYGNLKM